MVEYRSPKPQMWVRFLPLLQNKMNDLSLVTEEVQDTYLKVKV